MRRGGARILVANGLSVVGQHVQAAHVKDLVQLSGSVQSSNIGGPTNNTIQITGANVELQAAAVPLPGAILAAPGALLVGWIARRKMMAKR